MTGKLALHEGEVSKMSNYFRKWFMTFEMKRGWDAGRFRYHTSILGRCASRQTSRRDVGHLSQKSRCPAKIGTGGNSSPIFMCWLLGVRFLLMPCKISVYLNHTEFTKAIGIQCLDILWVT